MVKGLYTAHTGMVNEMKRMDVLANNLANSDTYGFKKEGTTSHSFKNELAIKIKDTSNYGLHKNLGSMTYGVHLGETYTDWDEGSFKVTDNPTDLAIGGKGFFAVAFTDKSGQTSVKSVSYTHLILWLLLFKAYYLKLPAIGGMLCILTCLLYTSISKQILRC